MRRTWDSPGNTGDLHEDWGPPWGILGTPCEGHWGPHEEHWKLQCFLQGWEVPGSSAEWVPPRQDKKCTIWADCTVRSESELLLCRRVSCTGTFVLWATAHCSPTAARSDPALHCPETAHPALHTPPLAAIPMGTHRGTCSYIQRVQP